MFIQPFIQTQITENTKAQRHWPLCGEFTGDRWIPRTNGQLRGSVTGLCAGNSPGTDDFPAQMASNAENVSIWWRHHATRPFVQRLIQANSRENTAALKCWPSARESIGPGGFSHTGTVMRKAFPCQCVIMTQTCRMHAIFFFYLFPIASTS